MGRTRRQGKKKEKKKFGYLNFIGIVMLMTRIACTSAQNYPDFSPLVEKILPSVVTIKVYSGDAATQLSLQNDNLAGGRQAGNPDQPEQDVAWSEQLIDRFILTGVFNGGSGFILSENGFIVTNAHVVQNADRLTVILNNGDEYAADIIGQDAVSDLAVLKIAAQGLVPARLADTSDALRPGQFVLGIGSPFTFSQSVTTGIISYVERTLPKREGNQERASYIQTDMLINPGNSGGPIVNTEGEIIGVSSKIFSTTGASIGISFGVPVEVIHNVVPQLLLRGEVDRQWIGMLTQDVDMSLVSELGLMSATGALVTQLDPDSPAQMSGLKVNDVIVSVNGHIVRNCEEFMFHAGMLEPGSTAEITAIRGGQYFATELAFGPPAEAGPR